jgi:hypothetical protein
MHPILNDHLNGNESAERQTWISHLPFIPLLTPKSMSQFSENIAPAARSPGLPIRYARTFESTCTFIPSRVTDSLVGSS